MEDESTELYDHPRPLLRHAALILLLSWVIVAPSHFQSLQAFLTALTAIFAHSIIEVIPYLLIAAGLIAIHELVHYTVSRLYGYNPDFGIRLELDSFPPDIIPNITIYNQYVRKQDNLVFLLAPLIVLSSTLLILSYLLPQLYILKLLFIVNNVGSIGDIYNAFKLSTYPDHTEFKNITTEDDFKTLVRRP